MFIAEALDNIAETEETKDQYDLAKKVGVSQGTISNYYKGKSYPTLVVAAGIYKNYGHVCEPFTEWAVNNYAEKYL